MNEEIKEYLKRVDELELKLTGKDKDTFQCVLFGYNECARLLCECKNNWNELKEWLEDGSNQKYSQYIYNYSINNWVLNKMKELESRK